MTDQDVLPLKPENRRQILKFLEDIILRSKVPGISVALYVNGDTLEAAAGISDVDMKLSMHPDMHFELGCLNKFLIAVVVLELFDKGLIDIEKAISYYLPELRGCNGDIIKVRHLLSHTAGYQSENLADPDIIYNHTWRKFTRSFNQRLMLFEPGTVFDYSHSATVILGKIIQTVTHRKPRALITELIMEPLDIKYMNDKNQNGSDCVSGHIFNPETDRFQKLFPIEWCKFWSVSLGDRWASMRELIKIGQAIIDDGSILSSSTKDLLLSRVVKLPGRFIGKVTEQPYFVFGLGCARFPNGSYGIRSNDSGQCCALRFDKENKMAIAVGINANSSYIRDLIIEKLWNAMLSTDAPFIRDFNPLPLIDLEMDELIGTYHGPQHHSLDIILDDDHLILRIGHNPAISYNTKENLLTLVKDKHGHIAPARSSFSIPIGFFRDNVSNKLGLMVGDNAYKKMDKILGTSNQGSMANIRGFQHGDVV